MFLTVMFATASVSTHHTGKASLLWYNKMITVGDLRSRARVMVNGAPCVDYDRVCYENLDGSTLLTSEAKL